jgi:hypothetical protein
VRGAVYAVTSGYLRFFCDAEVALWGSNQADGDGRSARADDRVRGVGRLAAASNVEHRDVDVTAFSDGQRPSLDLPTALSEMPQSSCGLLLTSCASKEPSPLSSLSQPLAAIRFLPSPILPFAPAPFCAVKPAILFGSVGLLSRMIQNRSMTQSLKLQYLTSPHVTARACVQHEAAEAPRIIFPLFPLKIDNGSYCIRLEWTF